MDKVWIWFLMSFKRQFKRPANLLLLLLFPLAVFGMSSLGQKGDGRIAVALSAGEAGLPDGIARRLETHEGMFRFYRSPSLEELEADVASRKAECGFAIPDDLEERLEEGRQKRSIRLYEAPSTVTGPLACEVVSSVLLELYGKELFLDYMGSNPAFSGHQGEEALRAMEGLYETRLHDGSTYSFAYERDSRSAGDSRKEREEVRPRVFPARGLVAVYVFVAGLFAAVTLSGDERRGLLAPLPSGIRGYCAFASVLASVSMAGIAGLLAVGASGAWGKTAREVAVMAAYVLLVGAVSFLLGRLARRPEALCGSIPFWIIGSLLLCPVFIDLGQWIPSLAPLGRLFPPYYYLLPFH